MTDCSRFASLSFTRRPTLVKAQGFAINRSRASVRKNEIGLRRRVKLLFKQLAKKVSQRVLATYGDIYKADELNPLPLDITGSILDFIGDDAWDDLPNSSKKYLSGVAIDGANLSAAALRKLGGSPDSKLATQNADIWGHHRSAEMVGRKWVGDKLVKNPDAKWAISNSTRDALAAEVEAAIANGATVSELAAAIQDSTAFSEARATMIARTEMAKADIAGSMEAFAACPEVTGKEWLTAGDDKVSEECQDNEADGKIGINEAFSSGDQAPPSHPNCRCAIIPVFADEMQ